MSKCHQVCHCGWSSYTTYHGLRTHQGKKGCTPMGMRIPESEQYRFNSSIPQITFTGPAIKREDPVPSIFSTSVKSTFETLVRSHQTITNSDKDRRALDFSTCAQQEVDISPQICHCGWSKVTTYQGLRTHQGMMGCTPKGMTIPQNKHLGLNSNIPLPTFTSAPIKPKDPGMNFSPTILKSVFETPVRSHETIINSDKARRALDFSTGAQQVQQGVLGNPPATAQNTAVFSEKKEREKEREIQALLKVRQEHKKAELEQKIQISEQKFWEIKLSARDCEMILDADWQEINSVFSEVVKAVEDARQKALKPLEERRETMKREKQAMMQKLEREINKLKTTIDELDKNPDMQVSLDEFRDWNNVSFDTSLSFGTLKATTSAMIEEINMNLEKLSSLELKRTLTFAVDVKLDPATAHQCLVVSEDGKKVRDGGKSQTILDSPERFDMFGSVLGLNRLTSGKSYWEVEVSNKTGWDLGVARGDVNRKGELLLNPDNGFWVTVHYENKGFAALTAPPVSLSLKAKPQKVGVFVDYEESLVSFYNVTTQSHIYSFTKCSFGGEIFPYFSPHLEQNGKNSDPLVICAL